MNRLAVAILAAVAAFPAGYGTHAYMHRHDAGEDFRRGRITGERDLCLAVHGEFISGLCFIDQTVYSIDVIGTFVDNKPKPPQPSYPAGGGQPR